MGVFDYVRYPGGCPVCGTDLVWQSKDADAPYLRELSVPELWREVGPARPITFYNNCIDCGTWVEITCSPGWKSGTDATDRRGPVLPPPAESL